MTVEVVREVWRVYEPDLYPERKSLRLKVRNMLKSGIYWDILCQEV
jgi:hypothetical protein